MKCISCERDVPFKERGQRRCPHCGSPFAFEPQRGDHFTDALFANAVRSVSGDGTLRFFVDHVYYSVCRRLFKRSQRLRRIGFFVLSLIATGIASIFVIEQAVYAWGDGGAIAIGVVALLALWFALLNAFPPSPRVSLDRSEFDKYWRRYTNAHGVPEGLLDPATAPAPEPSPDLAEELASYSFERAIVCERPEIADLLLANNFHFEHACAILAEGGHPAGSFETVLGMLRNNPELRVYALHDATVRGCGLVHRLRRDPAWFHDQGVHVEDMGLRPCHERLVRGSFLPIEPGSETGIDALGELSARERRWLRRHRAELAALRPDALLKRTFASILPDDSGDHFG